MFEKRKLKKVLFNNYGVIDKELGGQAFNLAWKWGSNDQEREKYFVGLLELR